MMYWFNRIVSLFCIVGAFLAVICVGASLDADHIEVKRLIKEERGKK